MSFKTQKFSPIDRKHSIYELIDEDDNVLIDISRSDEGDYEMALHAAGAGKVLPLAVVVDFIEKAQSFLEKET